MGVAGPLVGGPVTPHNPFMRCGGLHSTAVVALLLALAGCAGGPDVTTKLVFDGQRRTITTKKVSCTNQPGGRLLILVDGGRKRTVRVLLDQQGRLVVRQAGLRYEEFAGYVADPKEVTATKVDETYTFSGRMPPNDGETNWHLFEIETTCPYVDDPPPPKAPSPYLP